MPLPRVQPIAPIASKVPFDDNAWQFELKYDGFRALCYLEHRRNRFISRTGNILSRFDELADQAASEIVDFDEAILDGEVIAPDETGRPVFLDLLKRACRPAYVVFDLLWLSFQVPTFAHGPSGTAYRPWKAFSRRGPGSSPLLCQCMVAVDVRQSMVQSSVQQSGRATSSYNRQTRAQGSYER